MKKFILTIIFILTASTVIAASPTPDATVKKAIKKYNAQNYTGCMQDLETHIKKKPSALAYYYLGMSYAQAGKREESIESYTQAIELATKEKNSLLKNYASLGLRRMENSASFDSQDEYDEISGIIKRKNSIPKAVSEDLRIKHLEYTRNEINAGIDPQF